MSNGTRVCAFCATELPPRKKGQRGPSKKYCSEGCRKKMQRVNNPERFQARLNERNARIEASKPPRPKCESCGAEMIRRAVNRFCGKPECRYAAYKAKSLTAPRCSVEGCDKPRRGRGLCGPHYSAAWRAENPERAREIASRSRHARRANLRNAFVEEVSISYLLERDGWRCGICGKSIPKKALYPDPLSPSLDHVVPLAQGGKHEKRNAQAAHFMCNSTKSDVSHGDQLVLFG